MTPDDIGIIDIIYVFLFSLLAPLSIAAGFLVTNMTILLSFLTIAFFLSLVLGLVEIWRERNLENKSSEDKRKTEYQQGYREGYKDGYQDGQADNEEGTEHVGVVTAEERERKEDEEDEDEDEEEKEEKGEKMKETEKA